MRLSGRTVAVALCSWHVANCLEEVPRLDTFAGANFKDSPAEDPLCVDLLAGQLTGMCGVKGTGFTMASTPGYFVAARFSAFAPGAAGLGTDPNLAGVVADFTLAARQESGTFQSVKKMQATAQVHERFLHRCAIFKFILHSRRGMACRQPLLPRMACATHRCRRSWHTACNCCPRHSGRAPSRRRTCHRSSALCASMPASKRRSLCV
jgi:hypothetical protein